MNHLVPAWPDEEVVMKHLVKTRTRQLFGHILMLLVGVPIIVGVSGCEQNKQPLKVGFAGSLTGRYSDLGVAGRNAVTLAVEQINEAGGIHDRLVELIVKDDRNAPDVAVQVDKELIADGVVAIIGHTTSAMSIAVLPLIDEEQIVMVGSTTTADALTGLDDYFFRTNTPDFQRTRRFIQYIFHEQQLRTLALVYDLSHQVFSERWYQHSKSVFEGLGGRVSAAVPFSSEKDVSYPDIMNAVLSSQPEGVLIIANATDTATICQELRKAGARLPAFSTGWAGTAELIQHGGSAVEGLMYVTTFDEQSEHKRYVEFATQFQKRFKMKPNFASVLAYDAAQLLFSALTHAEDPRYIKQAILAQPIFHALQGDIRMDRYGDPRRSIFLSTVKNGELTTLKPLE